LPTFITKEFVVAKVIEGQLQAQGKSFALVVGRFNDFITSKLLEGALDCLKRHGADEKKIDIVWVPGSFEIPLVAKKIAQTKKHSAVVCLGAVIRGGTPHFEYVASEAAKGVAMAGMETGQPVIFGIITADTLEQAIERAGTKSGNKGWQAALAAIEMADLFEKL
jgi:6,7-dimethyl-8-ribityllumazine synthase